MKAAKDQTSSPQRSRYESLTGFYAADQRRLLSREHDVGLWWRADADGPLYRAAWVNDTGELYLVRLGPAEQGGGRVEVLGVVGDHERLEQLLDGWRERCGLAGSLGWLRAQLSRLASARPPALEASRLGLGAVPGQPRALLAKAIR